MKNKWSPGPWKKSPVSDVVGSLISSESGNVAAVMPQLKKEETEANATLVEHAPMLYDALFLVLDSLGALSVPYCLGALTKPHELLKYMDEDEAEFVIGVFNNCHDQKID